MKVKIDCLFLIWSTSVLWLVSFNSSGICTCWQRGYGILNIGIWTGIRIANNGERGRHWQITVVNIFLAYLWTSMSSLKSARNERTGSQKTLPWKNNAIVIVYVINLVDRVWNDLEDKNLGMPKIRFVSKNDYEIRSLEVESIPLQLQMDHTMGWGSCLKERGES